jgi:DNA-binding response OmpR family regulator
MHVIEAADGVQGLELARAEHPDVVTLDVMIPRLDGWHVAKELQEDAATRDIPIVFLTPCAEHRDRLRGLELGAVDYITVPTDPTVPPYMIERAAQGQVRRLDQ